MQWRLGVIGSPISHSLSPRLHEAGLSALGLTGASAAIDIGRDDAEALSAALATHDALSVTMPLKEVVVSRCDELDDVATRVGGVNSIRIGRDRVVGRATDGAGFLAAVATDLAMPLVGATVIVRGSGGSAKSIIDALVHHDAHVTVLARNESATTTLATLYRELTINPDVVRDVDLIVNTLPADVSGEAVDTADITFRDGAAAFDVVYEPRESPWLVERRGEGLRVTNGLSMLAHQARLQMQWWFERDVPIDALLEAVYT